VSTRSVPTWLLILLPLATGLAAGIVIGQHWRAARLRVEWRHAKRQATEAWRRRTNREQWHHDSLRRAAVESTIARRPHPVLPREIARRQLFADCVVGFEARDSVDRVVLFEVRAGLWQMAGHTVTNASVYRPRGFPAGDTIWVVVREMNCGELAINGFALLPVGAETVAVRLQR
jgi:hypothetical protein